MIIQRSTDWVGMRIPPNECIFDAFICKSWFDKSSIYLVDWPHTHPVWTLSKAGLSLKSVSIYHIQTMNRLMGLKSQLKEYRHKPNEVTKKRLGGSCFWSLDKHLWIVRVTAVLGRSCIHTINVKQSIWCYSYAIQL